jgi:predicted nucleic acid-binding protein
MNVVDSSGWIEYFSGGPNASFFAEAIEGSEDLIVPSLSLFEVLRHLLRNLDREDALQMIGAMGRRAPVALDVELATKAADLSVQTGLAMADSIIYTTAIVHDAEFWTQDADFEGMDRVRYRAKSPV